ncbi:hypothetical protein EDB86DRAFT_3075613 [Lactarius hatsudake]|nr:hypothetical protein EDB86DRAFT_3075613 [Lactarius hatsudake]
MGIAPIRVYRRWFFSLFVEALPTENFKFQRVWDIFLSEDMHPLRVGFLFRIGFALVTPSHAARHPHRGERAGHPRVPTAAPPFLLSSSPSALIELSSSFCIKDDDIRKQRLTQTRLSNAVRRGSRGNLSGHRLVAMAITLPRPSRS